MLERYTAAVRFDSTREFGDRGEQAVIRDRELLLRMYHHRLTRIP
ncbi:MAG: hypothetical protein V3T83_10135 [Acidobacteriota bacterium]